MPRAMSRTIYYPEDRPTDKSSINLEYDNSLDLDDPSVEAGIQLIVAAIAAAVDESIFFSHTVYGTWVEDGTPYDPSTMRVFNHGFNGSLVNPLSSLLDDTIALFIRKAVTFGNTGKIFLRWCMYFMSVTSDAGAWKLTSTARGVLDPLIAEIMESFRDSSLNVVLIGQALITTIYHAAAEGVKQVVEKVFAPSPTSRKVMGLTIINPTERQENNN